jgi:preprotein translocase subunit SecE
VSENTVKKSSFDLVLWLGSLALIVFGVWANYHYSFVDIYLRSIAWIALVIVVLLFLFLTSQGKRAWTFFKESRGELYKVIWPTRQETLQTSLLVIGLVILLSLIIWGLDSVLFWLVGMLTGQRG